MYNHTVGKGRWSHTRRFNPYLENIGLTDEYDIKDAAVMGEFFGICGLLITVEYRCTIMKRLMA